MGTEQITVELIDHMGSDLTTVNAARVSFDKESKWRYTLDGELIADETWKSDVKLIKYLGTHQHISPFGHAFASFRVTAPIFVCRQLVKHEYMRMNEISRRYVDTPPEFFKPVGWRERAPNLKQGSKDTFIPVEDIMVEFNGRSMTLADKIELSYSFQEELYEDMLKAGIAPEQARSRLGLDLMTSWWWSASLDAVAKMCKLRLDPHTQYESRLVAEQIDEVMRGLYPCSWTALVD